MAKLSNEVLVVSKPNSGQQVTLHYGTLKRAVLTLRALNHSLRRDILVLLESKKRMTVTEIYSKLKLEQSVASQHLAILRRADIVRTERDGKFIYYAVNSNRIEEVVKLSEALAQKS